MKRIFSLVLAVITATTLAFAGDFDCGSTVRLSATPNTGYHFVQWEKSANPGVSVSTSNPWDIEANSTNAGAYVAVFAINKYTVTFNANGHGTAPSAQTNIEHGSKATTPTPPTAEGYDFGGWYRESGCTNALHCMLSGQFKFIPLVMRRAQALQVLWLQRIRLMV